MPDLPRFHLAFPVTDLEEARNFYVNTLGCSLGRESKSWIDFYFYGHQIVAHKVTDIPPSATNDVEGKQVPANHFGVLLDRTRWESLRDKLVAANVPFLIEPHIRFKGEAGEQATMFITDPSGNGLEFKSFKSDADIFARDLK